MEQFFQEFRVIKTTVASLKNSNEDLRNEFVSCQREIYLLKESNLKQSDEIADLHREIAQLKEVNDDLLDRQIAHLDLREPDEEETMPYLSNKKVKDLKEEVGAVKGLNRPQADEKTGHQSRLNLSQTDTLESPQCSDLPPLPTPVIPPSSVGQHPSKTAPISMMKNRCKRRKELRKESEFRVDLYPEFDLEPRVPVWIGGYTHIKISSKFMCPDSGVYTTPVEGFFKFAVTSSDCSNHCIVNIYLCRKGDYKRELLTMGETNGLYETEWRCNANESVWVEVVLMKGSCHLYCLRFSGELL